MRSTDLLALPAVPIDQSYAIELQMCAYSFSMNTRAMAMLIKEEKNVCLQ